MISAQLTGPNFAIFWRLVRVHVKHGQAALPQKSILLGRRSFSFRNGHVSQGGEQS